MAITPQAGYEIDPNNPNSVRKIGSTAMPGSIASINQQQPNIAFGAVNTQPITVSALASNPQPVTTPVPKPDTTNYMAILDSAKNQALAIQKSIQTQQAEQPKPTEQAPAWYEKILSQLQLPSAPSSVSDAYATEYANAGIDAKAQAVTQAQQELDLLNADLQGIVDKATGKNLALENQGGAITAGGVQASSQANIREAAIQALPLQAQILAKQAILTGNQNNLKLAQDKLNTIFELKNKDVENKYKYELDRYTALYNVANNAQKNALDQKRLDLEAAKFDATQFNDLAKIYVNEAFKSGDVATAGKLALATTPEELNRLASGITTKPDELKQLQIAKLRQELAGGNGNPNEILSIADAKALGVPYGTTKAQALAKGIVPGQVGGTGGALQLAQAKGNIDTINSLLTSGGLSGAVGTSPFSRLSPIASLTGSKSDFLAGVQQITSQLSLDSLINAKAQGATFGALSEGELALLSASASKLNSWAIKDDNGKVTGYSTSEKNFKKELDRINNFAKLDYIIKGGDPADVNAVIQPDGTYWVLNSDGTYTQIK